jgi:hypothetical protein
MTLTDFQRESCLHIMAKLREKQISRPFQQELSCEHGLPARIKTYVEHPMDLRIVQQKLENGMYHTIQEWAKDVRSIWTVAQKLFRKDSPIWAMAADLSAWFESHYRDFPRCKSEKWLRDFTRTRGALSQLVLSYPVQQLSSAPDPPQKAVIESTVAALEVPLAADVVTPVKTAPLRSYIAEDPRLMKPKEPEKPNLFDIPDAKPSSLDPGRSRYSH